MLNRINQSRPESVNRDVKLKYHTRSTTYDNYTWYTVMSVSSIRYGTVVYVLPGTKSSACEAPFYARNASERAASSHAKKCDDDVSEIVFW